MNMLRSLLVFFLIPSILIGNDLKPLFLWVNHESDVQDVQILSEYLNGNISKENDRLLKLVDCGKIDKNSIPKELDKIKKLYETVKLLITIKDENYITFPCFSLSERGDKICIENVFYEDGKSLRILDYPSYFYQYIQCQILVHNLVFKTSDYQYISSYNESALIVYGYEEYQSCDETYNIKLQTYKINPNINIFPRINKRYSRRVEKILLNNEVIESIIEYPYDFKNIELKFLQHIHNNTFLDLSGEINKIKKDK